MDHLNVFTYGIEDILREIAKKGTESDIRIYNRKDENSIMTFSEPIRYPDKVSSLTDSIYPMDTFIINGNKLDKNLGEVILALDLFSKKKGIIVADEDKRPVIDRVMKDTEISYEYFSGRPMEIVDLLKKINPVRKKDKPLVVIDHYFKVKSVGTVVLGFVLSGIVKKHDDLYLSEVNRQVQIRSIQVNDVDVDEAEAGTRVGLALRNVEVEELSRGMFLAPEQFEYFQAVSDDVSFHRSLRNKDTLSDPYVSDIMNYVKCNQEGENLTFRQKLPVIKDSVVISDQNGFPRVVGKASISK
ncbi:hypothetical protein [Thermoplasma volcanium GSS1]|uniref:Translation elongation factor EFTu-like domain-containing protein n=1 Tax=Thermoplasma volcanium (strain ATCC 51530 / DSM 4299 / JCM 9571 / NBRC 15438 / GSS1) TaxID=273116 RepID=Q97BU2_THEVO|nr:EF-Tu/IF-2/RF-3 family GTPase [Thermoplasma volcanium]BAB59505.1 hypothetical protein [Thermoplasma volcanium GSS1]